MNENPELIQEENENKLETFYKKIYPQLDILNYFEDSYQTKLTLDIHQISREWLLVINQNQVYVITICDFSLVHEFKFNRKDMVLDFIQFNNLLIILVSGMMRSYDMNQNFKEDKKFPLKDWYSNHMYIVKNCLLVFQIDDFTPCYKQVDGGELQIKYTLENQDFFAQCLKGNMLQNYIRV